MQRLVDRGDGAARGARPCLAVCLRAEPLWTRWSGSSCASTVTTLALLLIAQGYRRDAFMDLAVVSAVLTFAGALAFARFLERWV